jgi:CrcB protein
VVANGTRGGQAPPGRPAELLLVALGAVPGALLRWVLHCDPIANLLGCLLIGLASNQKPPRPRLMLLLGIGFCGALTTFSGWILALATALRQGSMPSLLALLLELGVGIGAVVGGRALAARIGTNRRLPFRP